MSTIAEIKEAISKVSRAERRELECWIAEQEAGEPWTPEALRDAVQEGIGQLRRGECATYDEQGIRQLAADIKQQGRERLAAKGC